MADPDERVVLWPELVSAMPSDEKSHAKTTCEIPVVIVEPTTTGG